MSSIIAEAAIAKILDIGITLVLAGMERQPIVDKVREMEVSGATADQITDALQAMRQQSEKDAQAKIDAMPKG